MSMNFFYELPLGRSRLTSGWQFAGTGRAYSGQLFTPQTQAGNGDLGEPTRPDRIANGSLANPTPDRWFDIGAFPVVPLSAFRFGNSGRNNRHGRRCCCSYHGHRSTRGGSLFVAFRTQTSHALWSSRFWKDDDSLQRSSETP